MDKAEATRIMREAETALDAVFAAHNLKRKTLRAGYEAGQIRITATAVSTDPALDPKVTDWNRYAESSYGLPVDALGKTIVLGGVSYTITGLDLNRRKYPVTVTRLQDDRKQLLTVRGVKAALGLKVEAWD